MARGGLMGSIRRWGADHARACIGALGTLTRHRLATVMTAGVLGVALALPAGFLLALEQLQQAAGGWDDGARISLFLRDEQGASAAQDLAAELNQRDDVAGSRVISPDEALAELRANTAMDDALALLDGNPLPAVVVVRPATGLPVAELSGLSETLGGLEAVAEARLDRDWALRLEAILDLARRAAWLVIGALGLTVILVVGNTIRLAIENRREAIVVTKLIGGTDAFIRRPFLYEGAWYGLLGSALAAVLVTAGQFALEGPVMRLTALYDGGAGVAGLGLAGTGLLAVTGVGLGLCGSWVAVGRHLAAIEPRA